VNHAVPDALSDKYGFCVFSCDFDLIVDPEHYKKLLLACNAALSWCNEYEIDKNGDEGALGLITQLNEAVK